jgi:regulatory protein
MTEDQKEARDIAVRMLSRREYSRLEIQQKLTRHGCHQGDIENVLTMLVDNGSQSDERFAQHYARFRASKGYGPKRIRLELKEKGVDSHVIDQGLEQAEVDWFERAAEVCRKKFKGQCADTWEEKSRQSRFLDYRGFTREQIDSCLDIDD